MRPSTGLAGRRLGTRAVQSRSSPTPASAGSSPPAASSRRAKGDRMAVFTIEDSQGGVEVIAFPETYQRSAALIESGTLVLVRGKLERDDESVRVLASEIAPLDSVRERLAREVAIRRPHGQSRSVRDAGRDFLPPPRRPARVVRNRARGRAEAPARPRRRVVADSRAPVTGAHRGGGTGRRGGRSLR